MNHGRNEGKHLSREDLKIRFKKGAVPSETDFSNFIDSVTNILDDGIGKTPRDGLKIAQNGSEGAVVSFYQDTDMSTPQWQINLQDEEGNRQLHFSTDCDKKEIVPALTLASAEKSGPESGASGAEKPPFRFSRNSVGINNRTPEHELDVDGTISSRARIGFPAYRYVQKPVIADGNWYAVTNTMSGCQMLEIVAGVGTVDDSKGRYALIRAVAMNVFNRKRNIRVQHACFGGRRSRLQIRWRSVKAHGEVAYVLEMRTRKAYEDREAIQYYITHLWLDPLMDGSRTVKDEEFIDE